MQMRSCGLAIALLALIACGDSRHVAFVVETEGEARITEVRLRVGEDVRVFVDVPHGKRIEEDDLVEGMEVELHARNGGDQGALLVTAWVDDCLAGEARCDGEGCMVDLAVVIEDVCGAEP